MGTDDISFRKYVSINDCDLLLAIQEGIRPMQRIFDHLHDELPFFGNDVAGVEVIGNTHNAYFSLSHIPGRWLDGLLSAAQIPGVTIDKEVIRHLTQWAYASVEDAGIGLPAKINLETFLIEKQSLLHNLREAMHAFTALVKYHNDEHAKNLALQMIDTIDRYYVNNNFTFDIEAFQQNTGGTIAGFPPYPQTFGRYIGTLVKFYQASKCVAALKQAVKLKDYCFENILAEDCLYTVETLGNHTHSVTSMISSLALLGEELGDRSILERVERFLNNGLKSCTLDFGWCLVGYERDYLMGEINNTSDIMETCLILAKAGFPGYYEKAERILHAHFLPSQLLDTHFIPPMTDESDVNRYMLHENMRGAFGFPCPYGHEYEPGSRISFNWDVVGGAVSGLCVAYHSIVSYTEQGIDINLLFDYSDDIIAIAGPYSNHNMRVCLKKEQKHLSVRIPKSFHIISVTPATIKWSIIDDRIVFRDVNCMDPIILEFEMEQYINHYSFRTHQLQVKWEGERVLGMTSPGKRLCFFPEIE